MSILKLVDIKKEFTQGNDTSKVIKGVNLELKKGEFVSLVGPSGSGKTTLLQIAGLLDNPTSGKMIINDIDSSNANDATRTKIRRDNIGFIYQFHHLLPEFSALENVALPLLIQDKTKNEAFKIAKEILREVELETHLNHKPSQLSGGQQQRVAIARAIAPRPSIILADEPTGNLDSDLSTKIFQLLQELTQNHNIACLVVTHNLELANKANRIISIKDGVIS